MPGKEEEMFPIVTENGVVLRFKSESDCHRDNDLHPTSAVSVKSQGLYLMQKRALTKRLFPGMWTMSATGHLRGIPGKDPEHYIPESYTQAARREYREELGKIAPVRLTLEGIYIIEDPIHRSRTAIFTGEDDEDLNSYHSNPEEIAELAFLSQEQIIKMSPNLTPLARIILGHLWKIEV